MEVKRKKVLIYNDLKYFTKNVGVKKGEKSADTIRQVKKIDYDSSVKCNPCFVDLNKVHDRLRCKKGKIRNMQANDKQTLLEKKISIRRKKLDFVKLSPCYVNIHKWKNFNELFSCKSCPEISPNEFSNLKLKSSTGTVSGNEGFKNYSANSKPRFSSRKKLQGSKEEVNGKCLNDTNIFREVAKKSKAVNDEIPSCDDVNKNPIEVDKPCKCQQFNEGSCKKVYVNNFSSNHVCDKAEECERFKKLLKHVDAMESCLPKTIEKETVVRKLRSDESEPHKCKNCKNTFVFIFKD